MANSELTGLGTYGGYLASLAAVAFTANFSERNLAASAQNAPDSLSAISLRQSLDYIKLESRFVYLGTAKQKFSAQYFSSTGSSAIESQRDVHLYYSRKPAGDIILVSSNQMLPEDTTSVIGKCYNTKEYFKTDTELQNDHHLFLHVDFYISSSEKGLQKISVLNNSIP